MPTAPDQPLDVRRLAAAAAVLEFEFELRTFDRLATRLASSQGVATAELALALEGGVPVGDLRVRAELRLTCQRCLGQFGQRLESASRLAFVAQEPEAPSGREAIVGDARQVALAPLVEDELLLALPLIARHGAGEACAAPAARERATGAERETGAPRRPFSKLKELLKHESE